MSSDLKKMTALSGEVLPAAPAKRRYRVGYEVSLVGEVSGKVAFRGEIWRAAADPEAAMHDVHTYLIKAPLMMYPVTRKNSAELVTPDFPPEFNGRPFKSVSVWIDATQLEANVK